MARNGSTRKAMAARSNGARDHGDGRAIRVSRSGRPAGRTRKGHGQLLIIGGHEEKHRDPLILRELCRRVGAGKLVLATVASSEPEKMWETYEPVLRRLGCKHLGHLDIRSREDALRERNIRVLDGARALFFTGGDQLKITSRIGDTPIYERLREIYEAGGLIAGTSAGASVMSETMLVAGDGDTSHRIDSVLKMAPGLGFIDGVLIDQHFAERGRIGRLLGAVAQNARILGIGIDENTAILVEHGARFQVYGEGAVYVIDGRRVVFSNLAEEETESSMSVFGVTLHQLSQGDTFDIDSRTPMFRPATVVEVLT
jgi:cyanophycinase